jgi:hypothetical protein
MTELSQDGVRSALVVSAPRTSSAGNGVNRSPSPAEKHKAPMTASVNISRFRIPRIALPLSVINIDMIYQKESDKEFANFLG